MGNNGSVDYSRVTRYYRLTDDVTEYCYIIVMWSLQCL